MLKPAKYIMDMGTDINPTVSVILPTYNRSYIIENAVKSVLNQNFPDFELIIVDDGSTDNTEEIIKSFSDERIKYIKHKENRGASAARNTGLRISRGKYIAFIDSDDIWLKEKLNTQVEFLEESSFEIGAVFSQTILETPRGKKIIPDKKSLTHEEIKEILMYKNIIPLQSVLIKKICIEKTGFFDERFPRFQDWEFLFRIAQKFKISYLDKPLVISTIQPDGISANKKLLIPAFKLFIEKYKSQIKKSAIAKLYRRLGIIAYSYQSRKEGIIFLLKSLKYNPICIKTYIALIVAGMGENLFKSLFIGDDKS